MAIEETYLKLTERMGFPDSKLLLGVLTRVMTPEEGRFLLELPASNAELAAKFNQDEKTIHDLARRGLVVASKKGFRLARDPGTLRDNMLASAPEFLPSEVPGLWKDFYLGEQVNVLDDAWDKMEKPFIRVIPAQKSISDISGVMPSETVTGIVGAHIGPIALVNCSCRVMMRGCDRPVRACIHFGRRAEFDLFRGSGRELSADEAIAESLSAEEAGLINTVANASMPQAIEFLCHCCSCDCLALERPLRTGKVRRVLSASRFLAKVDQEICTGCQECVERCHFDAIEMVKSLCSKKLKAAIGHGQCMGCGLCTIACSVGAIEMECVRPPEHIPSEFIRVQ